MQNQFGSIDDVIKFLKAFNYNDSAILEVVRVCYFNRNEKLVFEYYPMFLEGRNQNEIGLEINKEQSKVSYLFKQCKTKLRFFKDIFVNYPVESYLSTMKSVLDFRRYFVMSKLLVNISLTDLAKQLNCCKANIGFIRNRCLRRLQKNNVEVYTWCWSILSFVFLIRKIKTNR